MTQAADLHGWCKHAIAVCPYYNVHVVPLQPSNAISSSHSAHPAGEPLLTEETIEHVTQIVAQHGSDAWWQMEVADLLPEHLRAGERLPSWLVLPRRAGVGVVACCLHVQGVHGWGASLPPPQNNSNHVCSA